MIYQYDSALAAPTMDIYDTGMLKSYIDAVKDDYNRGLAEQKEFMTKYGDFSSPIAKDVEWWNNTVNKPIQDFMARSAEAGIDMRSPEFRMALNQLTNRMPYAEMNLRKQYAKNAEEYKKNRDYLIRQGKFNADFERNRLGGHTLEDWDTSTLGGWNATSPEMLTDLTTFAKDATKGLKPSYIRSDSKYDYTGVSDEKVRKTIGDKMQDFLNTPSGQYYLSDIANKRGYDLQTVYGRFMAEKELFDDAVNRSGAAYETKTPNEYALLAQKQAYDRQLATIKQATSDQATSDSKKSSKTSAKDELDIRKEMDSSKVTFVPVGNVSKAVADVKNENVTMKNEVQYNTGEGGLSNAELYIPINGKMIKLEGRQADTYRSDKKIIKTDEGYFLQVTPKRNAKYAPGNLSDEQKSYYKDNYTVYFKGVGKNKGYSKPIKTAYLKVAVSDINK